MNKKEIIYRDASKFRKNIIVMGDIIDDAAMVNYDHHEIVLKVGFLNNLKSFSHLLPDYQETFDLLIIDDGTLHPINFILQKLFTG